MAGFVFLRNAVSRLRGGFLTQYEIVPDCPHHIVEDLFITSLAPMTLIETQRHRAGGGLFEPKPFTPGITPRRLSLAWRQNGKTPAMATGVLFAQTRRSPGLRNAG
ncbi:hypothetical protein LO50_00240 [Stutzerimonas stutzeri]|uniref:Uncharacterized protein n=1 Tax=Stutzerimonas stutzeri TaxID=316 RepID=A0A0D7EDG5_STUST|nr:hypothetical protein LO50_00240 [Stutzerimonas stutzeri]